MDDDTRASNDENKIYIENILKSAVRFAPKMNFLPSIKFNGVYHI